MSSKKTIQINPEFLRMNKSKKRVKRKKPDFSTTLKPNNIKKQLLQKIKEHQQKVKKDDMKPGDNNEKFRTDFKTSLNYLQKMIGEKKKRKHRERRRRHGRRTMRNNNNSNIPTGDINIMTPTAQTSGDCAVGDLSEKPKWGCLKGGKLPTWRQYQQTLKRKRENSFKIPPIPAPSKDILDRQDKLARIKKRIQQSNKKPPQIKMELVTTNRTLKIFKLGKKNNRVGVLIKSGKTRKIIKDEVKILKERSVSDIKKYLRKHNLIKAGSGAPENVLRKIYEDSYLAGDIYNKNPDHLIHNYIHNQ